MKKFCKNEIAKKKISTIKNSDDEKIYEAFKNHKKEAFLVHKNYLNKENKGKLFFRDDL